MAGRNQSIVDIGLLSQHWSVCLQRELNYAHTCWGWCTYLHTKLAAHIFSIYLNRLLGRPNYLPIKALTFPNSRNARLT
jgi:hypothetical protein